MSLVGITGQYNESAISLKNSQVERVQMTQDARVKVDLGSNVVFVSPKGSSLLATGSQTSLTDNTQATVATFTATAATSITKIMVTGDANAVWTVEVDSGFVFEWRCADGNRSRTEDYHSPFLVAQGSTIDIKVEHKFSGETGNFKASILGFT